MNKTRRLATVVAAVAVVLGIGAVSAYAGLADDATPPVTASDAAGSYWNGAMVNLTATDAEGIAYIYHELDDDVVRLHTVAGRPTSATLEVPRGRGGNPEALTPGTHTLRFWAQDVNGNVEAKNSVVITIKEDHEAPLTTPTGATGDAWDNSFAIVQLAATDGTGSGVKQITWTLDSATPVVSPGAAATVVVNTDGAHTLRFRAEDVLGNLEAERTLRVNIDTIKPAAKAPSTAKAYRGKDATLKYGVVDAAPNGGTAAVKIVVKNPAGKTVKSKTFAGKALDTLFAYKFTVPTTWRAGTYKFYVSATDTAGNASARAAVNTLVIR